MVCATAFHPTEVRGQPGRLGNDGKWFMSTSALDWILSGPRDLGLSGVECTYTNGFLLSFTVMAIMYCTSSTQITYAVIFTP